MTNQRAEIWAGIMVLATSALTLIPQDSLFVWPTVILTVISVGMLAYTLSKAAKEKAKQEQERTAD